MPTGSTLLTSGLVKIRGTGVTTPNYGMASTAATVDTTGLSVSSVPLSAAFPNTVCCYIPPVQIQWDYTNDNGTTWANAGISSHKIYVTLADPNATANLFQTVLETGCKAAKGDSSSATTASDIWSIFPGLNVKRAGDVNGMQYWGPIARVFPGIFDTAGLLKNADGRCGAWASFLVDVLGAQNITAVNAGILPTMPPPTLAPGWTFVASQQDFPQPNHGIDIYTTHPAQSNNSPAYHFDGHAVVKITGLSGVPGATVYDPSYGRSYPGLSIPTSEQNWENDAVQDYWWHCLDAQGNDRISTVTDPKGSRETKFDK